MSSPGVGGPHGDSFQNYPGGSDTHSQDPVKGRKEEQDIAQLSDLEMAELIGNASQEQKQKGICSNFLEGIKRTFANIGQRFTSKAEPQAQSSLYTKENTPALVRYNSLFSKIWRPFQNSEVTSLQDDLFDSITRIHSLCKGVEEGEQLLKDTFTQESVHLDSDALKESGQKRLYIQERIQYLHDEIREELEKLNECVVDFDQSQASAKKNEIGMKLCGDLAKVAKDLPTDLEILLRMDLDKDSSDSFI